ncbi:MAG: 4-hydroxy-tetrahydrodipicolinate synthase [Breznakibacter sp.]
MGIKNLRGSIVAIVTPFKANGEIDFETFDRLIDYHLENKTDGIVVCGTTGETPTLTETEDAAMIERAVKRVNGRIPVIAGTGSNSTHECVAYTQKAEELGVDAALIVAPYYNKPTEEGMYLHFSTVAKSVKIPIILYNVPGRTGSNISVKLALRLAKDYGNIIGIKEAQGNLAVVASLLANRPDGFKVYSGDDFTSMSTNFLGADGCISVVANVIPREFHELMDHSMNGKVNEARKIFFRYSRLMDLMFVESNPIPVKTAMAHKGMIAEVLRAPLCGMEAKNKKELVDEIEKLGI